MEHPDNKVSIWTESLKYVVAVIAKVIKEHPRVVHHSRQNFIDESLIVNVDSTLFGEPNSGPYLSVDVRTWMLKIDEKNRRNRTECCQSIWSWQQCWFCSSRVVWCFPLQSISDLGELQSEERGVPRVPLSGRENASSNASLTWIRRKYIWASDWNLQNDYLSVIQRREQFLEI